MSFQRRGRLWIPEAPNLILGRGPCPRPTLEAELGIPPARLEGWMTVELIDAKTQKVKRKLRFRNLIVDTGLDVFGNQNNGFNAATTWCAVGTGGAAPAVGQTTLSAEIAPAASNRTNANGGIGDVTQWGPANAYYTQIRTRLFVEAQGNGALQEIGFFSASSAGTMFSRQLLKDAGGVATVINKTAADQLRVTYEVRLYPPTVDVGPTSITISGIVYDYTIRARNVGTGTPWSVPSAWFNWSTGGGGGVNAVETDVLGAISSEMAGSKVSASNLANSVYVAGNFYRDVTQTWEPGVANFGTGIGGTQVHAFSSAGNGASFQIKWAPKFAKDATKRLTLITRNSWARYP